MDRQGPRKRRHGRAAHPLQRAQRPRSPSGRAGFGAFTGVAGGVSTIEETRIDPYVMLSGEQGAAKWEAGLRYETTDTTITDRTVDPADQVNDNDYDFLLPSASLRYNLNDRDRLIVSAARTVRRPNFDSLSPALLEEEVGDSDFIGNPDLVARLEQGAELVVAKPQAYYGGGARGYTDYPTLAEQASA